MKIDRLIGILSLLLQRERVTAPYLAEKFEVSRRTINRDIESLCMAGIPVVTSQGAGGGVSIAGGYKVDKTFLSGAELQDILAGLKSIDCVSDTDSYDSLLRKLGIRETDVVTADNSLYIDLGSWYTAALKPKIALLRNAIRAAHTVSFLYLSPSGENERSVDPYAVLFQWSSWYLWGYCHLRGEFRLFKINRMQSLRAERQTFVRSEVPVPQFTNEKRIFTPTIDAQILVEPAFKWRLVDEYGLNCFSVQEDGKLLFRFSFSDKEYLFSYILGFGGAAELLQPQSLRQEFYERLKKICSQYEET